MIPPASSTALITARRQGAPDKAYLGMLDECEFEPIFILGHHRSGTTLLYRLLAMTGCFNILDVYRLLRYNELLHNFCARRENEARSKVDQLLAEAGINNRGLDQVPVHSDTPEEYCYHFAAAGYSWRRFNWRFRRTFEEMCRKVQVVSDATKPLLLKNPFDFPVFRRIAANCPNAKFIFIHRHPAPTLNSQLKSQRYLFERRDPYRALIDPQYAAMFNSQLAVRTANWAFSSTSNIGLQALSRYYLHAARTYLQHKDSLDSSRFIDVRYEDLCAHPEESINRIMQAWGLTQKNSLSLKACIQKRPTFLLPEVATQFARMHRRLRPYMACHGYDDHV